MIAVDWGTTSLRAYRMSSDGAILEKREAPLGILSVPANAYPKVLAQQLDGWRDAPIVMSGMVGSRQGWQEAPYVQCPAGPREISKHLLEVQPGAWIVPGVSYVDESGVPDVMRGEETQVLGILDHLGDDALVCLPGTHSKWVRVRDGRITALRTHFTGEMFAVLKGHSLLGRMLEEGPPDERAFSEGVDRSGDEGGLLHHVFGVRTRALFGELGGTQGSSYLSGLLIGHELRSAPAKHVAIVGAPGLAALYARACGLLGISCRLLDAEAAPRGLFRLAKRSVPDPDL